MIRLKAETDFPLTIVTAPQSLVISTLLPLFFSRSSVSCDGCPYVFVAEQETTASSGLTISRNSAPVEYLEKIFTEAISHPKIVALSIGTRPDCLSPEIVALLSRLNKQKPVWIELGLQTIHESTARYIRRGYPLCVFDDAVKRLRKENIEVIVHTILGLPGENTADILETMEYLNHMDIQGIKLQLLHVLRGTDLAADYEKGLFQTYERDEYLSLLINCLEHLRPDIVIHRITGDGPKDLLIAPLWASRKREVLNMLHHRMKEEQSYQGRLFSH